MAGNPRWLLVLLLIGALIGSALWAIARPLPGAAALGVVLVAGWGLLRFLSRREAAEAGRERERLAAIAAPVGDAWRRLCEAEGLGALTISLADEARPAVRLTLTPGDALPVGASRVGGAPDLPAGFAWPEWRGVPLRFLAQLDLAKVRRVRPTAPLPEAGWLYFFFDPSQRAWGFDPAHRGAGVVHHVLPGAALASRASPDAKPLRPCAVSFAAYDDPPDLDEDHPLSAKLTEEEAERYLAIRQFLAGDRAHKLCGHPDPIQGPMELECQLVSHGIACGSPAGYEDPRVPELAVGRAEWRLLLQLDSDRSASMMWGDAGRLYFWIRERDLREGRFDAVWTILQGH